jgi:hypothetical protein
VNDEPQRQALESTLEQLQAAQQREADRTRDAAGHYAEARRIREQLRSREDALREVYELIYLGEADNALHGLDAYMIREGIYRGEAASSPASRPRCTCTPDESSDGSATYEDDPNCPIHGEASASFEPALMHVPTPVLVVLAVVAAFVLLATLELWLGVVVLAVVCLALGITGMVRS